jgi:gas vesicle protein
MKTTKKVLVGLLAGATAGAVLGVLLAPEKGAETRRKIMSKSGKFAGDMKEKFNGIVDKSAIKGDKIRQETDDLIAKGKQKFGEAKHEFGNTTM